MQSLVKHLDISLQNIFNHINEMWSELTLPDTKRIMDYRIRFIVDGKCVAKHHFPIFPKIGEVWKVPKSNYDGRGNIISVKIKDLIFDWEPLSHEISDSLYGWRLEVEVQGELVNDN